MSIAVIAGLGNPGSKYRNTRHNIGFACVDKLASKLGGVWKHEARFEAEIARVVSADRKLLLVKPQTFMNNSGRSLGAILRYHKLNAESLIVAYDDLTLDFARAKLSVNGSAAGHNGITDLLAQIGPGFLRYRIGIGTKPHKEIDLAEYVLSQFSKDEQQILADQMPTYLEHICLVVDLGTEAAMNIINQRTAASKHERTD
ncbi:MAG: PTH1 family peptidyl-tRNA hydrolase [Lentimonas sp.]|jgi:PTH1 family peptidyl-tRNA hydrolase